MRWCLLVALLLVLGAPQVALAGRASLGEVQTDPKYGYPERSLFFVAAPGERNRIVVTRTGADGSPTLVLQDAGAPVTADAGCTAIDEHTVSCPVGRLFVDAGDGDDMVTLPIDGSLGSGYVRGGEGADVLTGAGFLSGGPGNDVLTCPGVCADSVLAGGGGDDVLRGGSGKDVLSGDADGPPGPIPYSTVLTESRARGNDDIDGGPGVDTLTFRGRATDVAVDLAAGSSAGTGGEHDRLAGVENVSGGDGDDLLIGDAGANRIEGDSGDDRINGRGGNDYLLGNLVPNTNEFGIGYTPPDPGADTLRGGDGDDTLDAGSERGDVLSGGAGDDALQDDLGGPTHAQKVRCGAGTDTIDFVPRGQILSDCERLRFASGQRFTVRPQLRARGGLRYVFNCRQTGGCSMAVAVRVRASRPARRALSTHGAGRLAFLMRPRRAARRGDVVDATILVATAYGTTYAARWRVTL